MILSDITYYSLCHYILLFYDVLLMFSVIVIPVVHDVS